MKYLLVFILTIGITLALAANETDLLQTAKAPTTWTAVAMPMETKPGVKVTTDGKFLVFDIDWSGTSGEGALIQPSAPQGPWSPAMNFGVLKLMRITGSITPEGTIGVVLRYPDGLPQAWWVPLPDSAGKTAIQGNPAYIPQVRSLSMTGPVTDLNRTLTLQGLWIPRPASGKKNQLRLSSLTVVYDIYNYLDPSWEPVK